jgi:hypothetical protein
VQEEIEREPFQRAVGCGGGLLVVVFDGEDHALDVAGRDGPSQRGDGVADVGVEFGMSAALRPRAVELPGFEELFGVDVSGV